MTTDITELAPAMKAAAMKATPGQWVALTDTVTRTFSVHTPGDKRCDDVIKWTGFDGQRKAKENAKFIALTNPANVLALVEALEASDKQIAKDVQIKARLCRESNSLHDRLRAAEMRIAELECFRTAYMEWSDKTDWVNTGRRFGVVKPLGKHRADVLKAFIEHLEGRIAELGESNAQVIQSRDHYKRMTEEGLKQLAESRTVTVKLPDDLHPDTQELVIDFCTALAEKLYKAQLKYGYDADWKKDGWPSQCQAHFHQHIVKGDPRDVAAYCAFMWYHGWKTEAAQPAPVVPPEQHWEELCHQHPGMSIAGAVVRAAWWNQCRAAMLQAGNSPVIPDGYRLQPISEYEAMRATINSDEWPQRWIPVSERMPGSQEWVIVFAKWANQQVLCWDDVQNRWTDFEDQSYYADMFTHWMPLPAAPQEVR